MIDPANKALSLYIHWPFCKAKCPYCDFNSHVRPSIDHASYRQALLDEFDHAVTGIAPQPLYSVFFGGGTPSLMEPATVAAILEHARERLGFDRNIEISMEANPTSVEAARLKDFYHAGINRVSLGVQSLDDAALRFLGREHSADEARTALEIVRSTFERWSIDLIYGRPDQPLADWQAELNQALALRPSHISLYQLTIEPGTAFHRLHEAGRFSMPDDEDQAEFYSKTCALLQSAGLERYEISNYARPGHECRHNQVYWQYGQYIGVGPGAHGRINRSGTRYATSNHRVPERWLRLVQTDCGQIESPVDPAEQLIEIVMMGLRTREGVALQRLRAIEANAKQDLIDWDCVTRLDERGFLQMRDERLRLTDDGFLQLDSILPKILI